MTPASFRYGLSQFDGSSMTEAFNFYSESLEALQILQILLKTAEFFRKLFSQVERSHF